MAIRATATFDGAEPTSEQLPSAGGVKSSNDYQSASGVEVRRGFGKASVADASELQDNDVVTIDGVEVKASLAREMGLLSEVFQPVRSPEQLDPSLSAGAAAAPKQQQAEDTETTGTGNEQYDTAAKGLNEALDAGTMEYAEAQTYDTIMAQTAMAGIAVEDAVNTLNELAAGTKSELDIGSENANMLRDAEAKVTEAATKSAQAELGADGFQWLQNAAQTHEGVNRVIREYAVDRASGQHDGVTWQQLMEHIKSEIGAG